MSNKYDLVSKYWSDITDKLMSNKNEFANYLKFSSGIYKYDFSDAALIYFQNPNATKVADLKTWNNVGRIVNKGEKSISVFGPDNKCRYLFDISQTNGKREPAIWKLNTNLSERLIVSVNQKDNTSYQNMNEVIAASCVDNIKQLRDEYSSIYENMNEDQKRAYNRSVLSAARYIVSNRCQLNSNDINLDKTLNLDVFSFFKSKRDFIQFCTLVHNTAKNTLLSFEHELLDIMRKMRNEKIDDNQEHLKSEGIVENDYKVPFSVGDSFDIDDIVYKVEFIDIQNQNVKLADISSSSHTKLISIDDLSLIYAEDRIREKAIYNAIDTVLGNTPDLIIENTVVETNHDVPALTDEHIISEVLKNNDNQYERNTYINNFFNENTDIEKKSDYIRRIYRDGVIQFKIDGIDVGYEKTDKGLSVWKGDSENKIQESILSWNCVQSFISDLVKNDEYLKPPTINFDDEISNEYINNISRRIQCENAEEAEQLFNYLKTNEYTWFDGTDLTSTDWAYAEGNTYYSIDENSKSIDICNISALSGEQIKQFDIEKFRYIKDEFLPGNNFVDPQEQKYDLMFLRDKDSVKVYDKQNTNEYIALINSERAVYFSKDLPNSIHNEIIEYAQSMPDIYILPEIRKPMSDEPMVSIEFSENRIIGSLDSGTKIPFAQANKIFSEIDDNKYIGYDKTDFTVSGNYNGEDFTYSGRFDIGNGEGSLLNHIRNHYQHISSDPQYKQYIESCSAEERESNQKSIENFKNIIIPCLEKYSNDSKNKNISVITVEQNGETRSYLSDEFQNYNDAIKKFADSESKFLAFRDYERITNERVAEIEQQDTNYDFSLEFNIDTHTITFYNHNNEYKQISFDEAFSELSKVSVTETIATKNYSEIDSEMAITMWENGFDVYADNEKLPVYEEGNYTANLSKYDILSSTYLEFSAKFEDVENQQHISSLTDKINSLSDKITSDFVLSDYAKDYDFDWDSTRNQYINIEKSLLLNKSVYLEIWLDDMRQPENSEWDELAEEATKILDDLKEFNKKYISEISIDSQPELKEKITEENQLDLFSIDYSSGEPVTMVNKPPQNVIDDVLRNGGLEYGSSIDIIAYFQKGKSLSENAEFLKKEYGVGFRGHIVNDSHFATGFNEDGIFINFGETINVSGTYTITWEEAAERTQDLLEQGIFSDQNDLFKARYIEMQKIAASLWYLHQDSEVDYFIPSEMFEGGFPESTERIAETLKDKDILQNYIDGLTDFMKQYENDRNILRFHFHDMPNMLEKLNDLKIEPKIFKAEQDFNVKTNTFISNDEITYHISKGGIVDGGKFRLNNFFSKEHTLAEQVRFIKDEYGIGGYADGKYNEWHDAKGIRIERKNPFGDNANITLSWNTIAKETERLVRSNQYITSQDIARRIQHAEYVVGNSHEYYTDKEIEKAHAVLNLYGKDVASSEPVPVIEKMLSADKSIYEGMTALVNSNKKVYIGKTENYDNQGNYDNTDNSLVFISENTQIFSLISERQWTETQQNMLDNKSFTLEDYREFTRLQNDVLSRYNQLHPVTFDGKPFEPVSDKTALAVTKQKIKAHNYSYHESDIVTGGAKTKYVANIAAIKTLQQIESEDRNATPEEQSVMAKYSGWGGIPQAFDKRNDTWKNEYAELKDLLLDSEYTDARASTLTSFYTPPAITDAVYQALDQFGFKGGNVLEPSMGVGNFIAKMPQKMQDKSRIYGVELDSISGRIAQKLYPNENIQVKGFEKTNFNDNSFDVVLGNIPFGDYKLSDKEYDKHNFKIHDYFAAKAVDKVKPGGIVAIVTSKFTMDKQNETARQYLAERCDLLGAVRLPDDAFKGNAGTTVTTDILFFQKRDTQTLDVPEWVHMSETDDGVPCNKYFVDNPDMVLGKMEFDQRMRAKYGPESKATTCTATGADLNEQLKYAISKINGVFRSTSLEKTNDRIPQILPADPSVRNYTHTLVNGELYYRKNEAMIKVEETGKKLDRLLGLHSVRQAALAVIDAQAKNCTDVQLHELQKELNKIYDKFVSEFGFITDNANAKVFRYDDDYNTIAAFETSDKTTGKIVKAEIFSKRTITPEIEITSVDNPQEALQVSLDRMGKVDINYMAKLSNIEPDQIIAELSDSIYRNPAYVKENEPYSGYEDASEYLSGNIREKLDIANQYSKKISNDYARNVTALEKALPKKIEANDISVRIGVNWIENDDYTKFMRDYAKADMYTHPLRRTPMGEYKIEHKGLEHGVNAALNFGTSRMNSYEIFENLLNNRDIVVKDRKEIDDKVTYVINQKETQLAKDKATKMKDAFKSWVWKDINRREYYVEKYNRLYNSIKGREYDGSHQTFPGMNPAIKLRPHQQNAILRAKLGGNTLLAHCVGAGKSFEIDTSVMEKKRLGLINKACIVVPKHLTMQTAIEWQRLYPQAKLLVATPKDFEKENRQQFIAKCVTGDYDGIIMSFNQFEKIPMSNTYRQQFVQKELDKVIDAIDNCGSNDKISVKDLERTKRSLENKLEKLMNGKKDNSLTFEQLGFDYLVVDEAHNYKNCLVVSKMSNVSGVQTTGAAKSEDMLMKTQYLNEKYNYKNVLFATGTPVSNSMVELYSMKRYLRPDLMLKADIQTFDDWASTFGEVVSQLEMKPAGDGFRMKNRFSKFTNIPELMQMYKEFADIQTQDMINLPGLPKMQTGKPIVVKAKPDELQLAYMKELARRSEAIHSGSVNPKEDNMLKITHEARLLGLDSRCINRDFIPNPDSKVNQLVDNLERIRQETDNDKGIQIVFCDIAINEDSEHFSVYNAVKDELIKRGIPENEVCFAGDAKNDKERTALFEQLRQGEKRIIIASTSKLGTGANIQNRIAAIHHLDIPWKPSDLEQQNGRGLRQGNMFKEVGIYHYVTENTFDAYMLGIITNKAKFISQVMTSKEPARTCDDVDEMVLTYAEMQAITSGNPLLKEKIVLDNEVTRLKMLESEYKKSLYDMQELAERRLPTELKSTKTLLEKARIDLKTFTQNRTGEEEFLIKIGNNEYTERTKAGDELEKSILKCATTGEKMQLGEYNGFNLLLEKDVMYNDLLSAPCKISLTGELSYTSDVSLNNNIGNIRRIENLASVQIGQRVMQLQNKIESIKENLTAAQEALTVPFEHSDELAKAVERLSEVDHELGTDIVQDDMPVSDDELESSSAIDDLDENRNVLLSSRNKFEISKKEFPQQKKTRGI